MKRPLPTDKVLEQYIYDYGFEKALDLFHLKKEAAYKILHWEKPQTQYFYNTVVDKPLHKNSQKIAEILSKHYTELKKQYTTYLNDTIYMSQTTEDFFQKAFIRCLEVGLEEVTDEAVLELFRIQFNTIRYYARLSQWTNNTKLTPLEVQNDEGEYIIPSEYAIPKETI